MQTADLGDPTQYLLAGDQAPNIINEAAIKPYQYHCIIEE